MGAPASGTAGWSSSLSRKYSIGFQRNSDKSRASGAKAQPNLFGLRRESRRAGATPPWKLCSQSKSGVVALLCHRSPKSSFASLQCYLATSSHSAKIFYEEARKPRNIGKNSWFPGFLMELFLVAATPRCGFALISSAPAERLRGVFNLTCPEAVERVLKWITCRESKSAAKQPLRTDGSSIMERR
jgi:hypothetical protein